MKLVIIKGTLHNNLWMYDMPFPGIIQWKPIQCNLNETLVLNDKNIAQGTAIIIVSWPNW